jgi:predicted amidophosphoribosyltransferase
MRVIKNIINFLFPEKCLVCKKYGDFICQNCASKIETNVIDKYNTLSIFPFRNKVVNKLLWNLKYYHSHSVAKNLTHAATPHILKWLSIFPNDQKIILIPMPKNENDKRLYNHAALIAHALKENLERNNFPNVSVVEDLVTKNTTNKQAHIKNKRMRLQNVQGKFFLNETNLPSISEKDLVIIVDDITTTGASIAEVKTLISENYKIDYENILAITLAH